MADPLTLSVFLKCSVITTVAISTFAILSEPTRQQILSIATGVAAGAYMNGGLGPVEFGGTIAVAVCATKGLRRPGKSGYRWLAAGWVVHTLLDVVHHVHDLPMVAWIPTSSAECAITDLALAGWMLMGAPGWDAFGRGRKAA